VPGDASGLTLRRGVLKPFRFVDYSLIYLAPVCRFLRLAMREPIGAWQSRLIDLVYPRCMATIIVTAGQSEGYCYLLGKRPTVIGRNETCDMQLMDERVSGKHLQVRYDESASSYRVLDMKSTNGTYLQNRKLQGEHRLLDNDEINIGNSRLLFTNQDFPDQASAMLHVKIVGEMQRSTIQIPAP